MQVPNTTYGGYILPSSCFYHLPIPPPTPQQYSADNSWLRLITATCLAAACDGQYFGPVPLSVPPAARFRPQSTALGLSRCGPAPQANLPGPVSPEYYHFFGRFWLPIGYRGGGAEARERSYCYAPCASNCPMVIASHKRFAHSRGNTPQGNGLER